MWAKVELNDEIRNFIQFSREHNETFEEMKELVFTKERLAQNYSMTEMLNLSFLFKEIKNSAFVKVLNSQKLNFPEGFVFERLLTKYENKEILSVEDHFNQIEQSCSIDRKSKRENNRKIKKLYSNFLKKMFN